jgi:hypothetical protein
LAYLADKVVGCGGAAPRDSQCKRILRKSKISLDVFLAFLLKHALHRGVNRVKVKNRQKIKISLDAFLAFPLKPRLVSNSIYEKEIH